MSSRRAPLSINKNVANSPMRVTPSSTQSHSKPKRPFSNLQKPDETDTRTPPSKKQALESAVAKQVNTNSKARLTKGYLPSQQSQVQSRRNASSYESKLAQERAGNRVQQQQHGQQSQAMREKDLENIRHWRAYHRAQFPLMVFYFESVPADVRAKLAKQVSQLGAREEKFFSIDISHVVTTRTPPPDKSSREQEQEDPDAKQGGRVPLQTINPSFLGRPVDRRLFTSAAASVKGTPLTTSTFPPAPARKTLAQIQDVRAKRNMDVLCRAREMGKKIWQVEKLQRMLRILLETDVEKATSMAHAHVGGAVAKKKTSEQPNLQQLLQNERENGPSDRDPTVVSQDMHYFTGPYLFIYDFEEKQKPIMVREYHKVLQKVDGDWPQIRHAAPGRCIFERDSRVADVSEKATNKTNRKEAQLSSVKPRVELQYCGLPPQRVVTGQRTPGQVEMAQCLEYSTEMTEATNPPTVTRNGSVFGAQEEAGMSRSASGRLFGAEPAASGLQPSNITSAIRSQIMSSTASGPGGLGTMSKEMHDLQRKVLQRNSSYNVAGSHRTGSVETRSRDEAPSKRSHTLGRTSSRIPDPSVERVGASRIAEPSAVDVGASHVPDLSVVTMAGASRIPELSVDFGASRVPDVSAAGVGAAGVGDDYDQQKQQVTRRAQPEEHRANEAPKREAKEGYCENCNVRFLNFDLHVLSTRHRKVANDADHWEELDDLLNTLQRVPKHNKSTTWTPPPSGTHPNRRPRST